MSSERLKSLFRPGKGHETKARAIPTGKNGHTSNGPGKALEVAFGYESIGYHQELLSGLDVQRGAGDIATLCTNALPKTRIKKTQRAQHWLENDDLLYDLVDTKRTFTIYGFHLQVKSSKDATTGDIDAKKMAANQTKADEFAIATDFFKVMEDLLTDWFVTDSMILTWKISDQNATVQAPNAIDSVPRKISTAIPGLDYIGTIDPADVYWQTNLGQNRLWVKVPEELEKIIQATVFRFGQDKAGAIQELLNSGIPRKWIDAVIDYKRYGSGAGVLPYDYEGPMVELLNADGEYWIVKTKGRKNYSLCSPSMYTIFIPLETRRLFSDGEFAAGYMLKHFIQHVKVGESITSGPLAGQTKNWAKQADINLYLQLFANAQKAMRLVTNHTVTIEWLYPPVEIFSPDKYISCERKIFRWSGVNSAIIGGEKQSTAEAFVGLKRMIADMWLARTKTSAIIQEFFRHPSVVNKSGIADAYDVVGQFDENVLKDPRQLLDEVRFLIEDGMGDPETTLRELGRDPDSIKLSKINSIEQNSKTKIYEPVYDRTAAGKMQAQDGRTGGTKGGKPAKPDTIHSQESRLQTKSNRDTPPGGSVK